MYIELDSYRLCYICHVILLFKRVKKEIYLYTEYIHMKRVCVYKCTYIYKKLQDTQCKCKCNILNLPRDIFLVNRREGRNA